MNQQEHLVTNVELVNEKPFKVTYPRKGYAQPVFYTVNGKQYRSSVFAEKLKEVKQTFDSHKTRVSQQKVKVTLNEQDKISMVIVQFGMIC